MYKVKSSKMEAKVATDEVESAINIKLLELQKDEVESEIEEIMTTRKTKGRSAAIFGTLQKICGGKKSSQEQVAMIDPCSKLSIFDPNEIKTVSVQYCVDMLTKHNSYEDYADNYYIQDMIHIIRSEGWCERKTILPLVLKFKLKPVSV